MDRLKVQILTTVWQRPEITLRHINWMRRFKEECAELGVDVEILYVVDLEDPHCAVFCNTINVQGHTYLAQHRVILSEKLRSGLSLLSGAEFDYLMHLDSDEFISIQLMERWIEEMRHGNVWFGSRSCYFYDIQKNEAYEFKGYVNHPCKNGGMCIHRSLLEACGWDLWPGQAAIGLNGMEHDTLGRTGAQVTVFDVQEIMGVVEVKHEMGLHTLDWFTKRDMLTKLGRDDISRLINCHPILHRFLPASMP